MYHLDRLTVVIIIVIISSVHSQLTFYLPSDKVSEGPCINPPPTVAPNINAKWLKEAREYYISYGNKAMVRRYAEVFLSRPAKSVDELDTLCLKVYINGKNVSTYAYGNLTLQQSCTSKSTGVFNCFAMKGSPGVNTTAIDTSTETVVYTDNASVILLARCINDEVRDYKLLTTNPNPGSKVVEDVKKKIVELGFTSLYATKLNCDGKYAI